MKKWCAPCYSSLLLMACFSAYGQVGTETFPKGARSLGMANASVTLQDGWSVFNNIGGLASLESSQAFFGYDHRLGLNELTTLAAGLVQVHDFGVFGLGLSHYGGTLFNQQNIGVGFSNSLGIASFGFKINYFQTNIEGFGRKASPVLEFGGVAALGTDLFFGAHVYNFTRARLSKISQDYLPTVIKAGISYRLTEQLMVNIEGEKEIRLDPQLKMGLEYVMLQKLWLRTGVHTHSENLFFGLGFRPKRFLLNYALSQNYRLGYTHHFSLDYYFNEN